MKSTTGKKEAGERTDQPRKKATRKSAAKGSKSRTRKKEEAKTGQETEAAPAREEGQLDLIRRLIERLSSQLTSSENSKGTLGDLLKLLQLEKELTPQQHRELVVSWETPWDQQ